MSMFVCSNCGHIEFDEAPETCLVCRAAKSAFEQNADAIKQPADPNALTDAEKKHIPKISLQDCGLTPGACKNVNVRVGDIEHVMQAAHYIRYVDFYLDRAFVSRVWLSPEVCHPAATLHLNADSGTVTVVENCNLHGNWAAETTI